MESRPANTYFWIQKKNEKNENMVVINGEFSTFDQLPHSIRFFKPKGEILVEKTSKTKISIQRMYEKNESGQNKYQVVCLICVSGWLDEKDASERNIAYTFYYVTPQIMDAEVFINADVLTDTEKNLKDCLKKTNSLAYFDEKDFNECFSRVDPQTCNNEMKNIWTKRYEGRTEGLKKLARELRNDPTKIFEGLTAITAAVAAGVSILGALKKKKKNEVNND